MKQACTLFSVVSWPTWLSCKTPASKAHQVALKWCNDVSIKVSHYKIYVVDRFSIHFYQSFGGGSQESHLTPLSTRTTNKELNVASFMTKMMQWSSIKLRVLRFMFLRVSVLTSLTYHTIDSVLSPILGRSSRKPPDPPSPPVGPIRNWAPLVSWLKWSIRMSIEASSFKIYVFKSFWF